MPATIAAPAVAAPATPSTPAPVTPKNGAHTEAGQPPATDPKVNAKSNTEPGAKPGETAAQTRQRLKVKLRKLDGPGEEELELDEADVGRYVQKARVADKNRGAFDAEREAFYTERDAALKDPLGYFRERNVDLIELGKQEAARAEELAKLDPVQRELAETRSKLEKYETERTAAAEKAKVDAEANDQRMLVLAEQTLYKQAIAASGRGAKTPAEAGYLMRLYADVREMAEHAGVPLTAEQLAQAGDKLELQRFKSTTKRLAADPAWRAKNLSALQELATGIIGSMTGAEMVQFFGAKAVAAITRESLAGLRKNPLPMVADPQPPPGNEPPRPPSRDDRGESLYGQLDRLANR